MAGVSSGIETGLEGYQTSRVSQLSGGLCGINYFSRGKAFIDRIMAYQVA
jgi:hypothetical protein